MVEGPRPLGGCPASLGNIVAEGPDIPRQSTLLSQGLLRRGRFWLSLAVRRRLLNRSVKATRGCGRLRLRHPVRDTQLEAHENNKTMTEETRGSRQLVSVKRYHLVSP